MDIACARFELEHQNPDEFWLCELCMKVLHRLYLVHATALLGNPDFKHLFGKHFLNKAWIVHCDSSNKGVYCG